GGGDVPSPCFILYEGKSRLPPFRRRAALPRQLRRESRAGTPAPLVDVEIEAWRRNYREEDETSLVEPALAPETKKIRLKSTLPTLRSPRCRRPRGRGRRSPCIPRRRSCRSWRCGFCWAPRRGPAAPCACRAFRCGY